MIGVCVWCQDIARHEANLRTLTEARLAADHPLVDRTRRRLAAARQFDARKHPDSTGTLR